MSALLSPVIFATDLSVLQWVLVGVNVLAAVPVPSHHVKDDEDTASMPGMMMIQDIENVVLLS